MRLVTKYRQIQVFLKPQRQRPHFPTSYSYQRMVGANKSWALFATPWGFIMDSMGMEVTIFSAGPFLTFLIFLGVFVSFIYYFSYAMGKTYVIELIGSKRLSTKVKDGYLILNEPGIIDYARCLGYAFALTTPVGIIYSLS